MFNSSCEMSHTRSISVGTGSIHLTIYMFSKKKLLALNLSSPGGKFNISTIQSQTNQHISHKIMNFMSSNKNHETSFNCGDTGAI